MYKKIFEIEVKKRHFLTLYFRVNGVFKPNFHKWKSNDWRIQFWKFDLSYQEYPF